MLWYLPICVVAALFGSFLIGDVTNELQVWYRNDHDDAILSTNAYYEIHYTEDGQKRITYLDSYGNDVTKEMQKYQNVYWMISNAQMLIIPAWVLLCIATAGVIFYNRELREPIDILLDASKRIADNELDFKVEYKKQNELGMLCTAFDEMRSSLYENNREMWRSLEERKRLNSAFSHDLRTPLTVLRGYADFLEKYVPDGKISEEKLMSVISMMNGQISRLEHYTQKMNTVQKLEDIVPNNSCVPAEDLAAMFVETGKLICGDGFSMNAVLDSQTLYIDAELVMQVYENLVSNAARYAKSTVTVECEVSENMLRITVCDDGGGFSDEALKNASQPFFRDEKEPDKLHFGLGLYICRILCEKCGGELAVDNFNDGGRSTAKFFCG